MPEIRLLHLVDTLSRINFGIWNTIPTNFGCLENIHQGIVGYDNPNHIENIEDLAVLNAPDFNKADVILTHGCWKQPTKTGYESKMKNLMWIAIPHGMLEPWSMHQKRLKKLLYFHLIEKPKLKKADALIAVSSSEKKNLEKIFPKQKVLHIPNAIIPAAKKNKPQRPIRFLFMARLHHKKGIIPLIKAWLASNLTGQQEYKLSIAGPDDGELDQIKNLLSGQKNSNIEILGAIYGKDKTKLLDESHFYMLPSFSEGFPSSLLEASSHGCVPIFTHGCNFPEAEKANIGVLIKNDQESIRQALNKTAEWAQEKIRTEGQRAKQFVDTNYNAEKISRMYQELLTEGFLDYRMD